MDDTIFQLIPKIIGDVGTVAKTGKNTMQNYAYRKGDEVVAALQPLFAKHGVFLVPEVLEQSFEQVRVGKNETLQFHVMLKAKHTLYASDGSFVAGVTTGEATDSGDKAANKAMTSAVKYFLTETFSIPTVDPKDTEEKNPELTQTEPATPARPKPPITKNLLGTEKWIKWLGGFPNYDKAMTAIKAQYSFPVDDRGPEAFVREFFEARQ